MPAAPASFLRFLSRALLAFLAVGCLLALAPPARAQDQNNDRNQLSDDTSDALEKLQPLVDAKNWDGALGLVDGLLAKVGPTSYDRAFLLDTKAKIYLQEEKYGDALAPWEEALRLADQYHYFTPKIILDDVFAIGQIYYQESTETKDREEQRGYLVNAEAYLGRGLKNTPKRTQDQQLLYAMVLYSEATLNPSHVDPEMMKRAEQAARDGLLISLHPEEGFYQILIGAFQEENNLPELARYLELLVLKYPKSKSYWDTLFSVYVNLASDHEKQHDVARDYYARAINTIERAQAIGLLRTPKDYFNLFTVYNNAGQFGRATELLDAGLKDGRIESTLQNWEYLANSYQLNTQPFQAIATLKRAEEDFPDVGQLDAQIGQVYGNLYDDQKAYDAYKAALAKGRLQNAYDVRLGFTYYAYELGKLDEALKSADQALAYREGRKDPQLIQLRTAILDTIKQKQAKAQKAAEAGNTGTSLP